MTQCSNNKGYIMNLIEIIYFIGAVICGAFFMVLEGSETIEHGILAVGTFYSAIMMVYYGVKNEI